MTTKQYVKKYHLDVLKENHTFNRDEFLGDLRNEFLERIQITRTAREKTKTPFTFDIFQNIVKEMQNKFWAISNKVAGSSLTGELFSAFYAMAVIPARKEMFPEEHERITARREKIKAEIAKRKEEEEKAMKSMVESLALIAYLSGINIKNAKNPKPGPKKVKP